MTNDLIDLIDREIAAQDDYAHDELAEYADDLEQLL